MTEAQVKNAVEKFEALIRAQSDRSDKIKTQGDFTDFKALDKIIIGVCGGDGIGPVITKESARVLEYLLDDKVKAGKIEFKVIDGLTIENRVKANKAIPDDVLEVLKRCHVILKGPTTTPQAGDPWPNIESANVAMRKALDLFANLRPVKVPEQGIDWTFFRENTEGAYAVGSMGVNVTDDLALDFVVTTTEGCDRIARLAYDYARRNNKGRVSIITKANVIKTTDGKFLNLCKKVGEEYPDIVTDEWYIDITTAKLIDEKRRRDFRVFILPNLYAARTAAPAASSATMSWRQSEKSASKKIYKVKPQRFVLLRLFCFAAMWGYGETNRICHKNYLSSPAGGAGSA